MKTWLGRGGVLVGTISAISTMLSAVHAEAQPAQTRTSTKSSSVTSTSTLSKEDLELARYLNVLEDLDLLEELELVEVLPLLEVSHAK